MQITKTKQKKFDAIFSNFEKQKQNKINKQKSIQNKQKSSPTLNLNIVLNVKLIHSMRGLNVEKQ